MYTYLIPAVIDSNGLELSCAGSKYKACKASAIEIYRQVLMCALKQVKISMDAGTTNEEVSLGIQVVWGL